MPLYPDGTIPDRAHWCHDGIDHTVQRMLNAVGHDGMVVHDMVTRPVAERFLTDLHTHQWQDDGQPRGACSAVRDAAPPPRTRATPRRWPWPPEAPKSPAPKRLSSPSMAVNSSTSTAPCAASARRTPCSSAAWPPRSSLSPGSVKTLRDDGTTLGSRRLTGGLVTAREFVNTVLGDIRRLEVGGDGHRGPGVLVTVRPTCRRCEARLNGRPARQEPGRSDRRRPAPGSRWCRASSRSQVSVVFYACRADVPRSFVKRPYTPARRPPGSKTQRDLNTVGFGRSSVRLMRVIGGDAARAASPRCFSAVR
jgi:hypothetical protein